MVFLSVVGLGLLLGWIRADWLVLLWVRSKVHQSAGKKVLSLAVAMVDGKVVLLVAKMVF